MVMFLFWWNFDHWKLSKWQLPVQPVIKISSNFQCSKWWKFHPISSSADDENFVKMMTFSFQWMAVLPQLPLYHTVLTVSLMLILIEICSVSLGTLYQYCAILLDKIYNITWILVWSWMFGCLVTWFCHQLITRQPNIHDQTHLHVIYQFFKQFYCILKVDSHWNIL